MKIKVNNIKSFWGRVRRFGVTLPLTGLFLTYFGKKLPYSVSKKIANWRHMKIEKEILSIIGELPNSKTFFKTDTINTSNENIWVLWLQGEEAMPDIVKLCLMSIRKNSSGHPVVVLSWNNLTQYISLQGNIIRLYEKGTITAAHLSDIIRMALLNKHGGFWIDATMYLVSPLPIESFRLPLYTLKDKPHKSFFVSEYRWAGFFFSMRQGAELAAVATWIFNRYWEREKCLIDYFMIDYVIDIVYQKYAVTRNAIDTIPYNNCNVHNLNPILCEEFNNVQFKILIENTAFFKLSWKRYSKQQLESSPTNYYQHLRKLVDY